MSLNVEALGFGRGGDAMPTAMIQPPPLFPVSICIRGKIYCVT